MERRLFLSLLALPGAWTLSGCGGSIPKSGGGARSKVLELHSRITGGARALSSAGMSGNGLAASAPGGGLSGGGASAPPMLGAFLNFGPPPAGGGGVSRRRARPTRQEDPTPPTFYFDEFLRLWVRVQEAPGKSRYDFFLDEAASEGAGFAETRWPEDWSTFPQVWQSSYRFDAGELAGAAGEWETHCEADGSGRSTGNNVWMDGSTNRSSSEWFANGDSTWSSRSDAPGDWWTESSGTFRHDGSGGLRHRDSDGYGATYVYLPDGSGKARFEGPTTDFPITIHWNGRGEAWITYADGRREPFEGWWGCWWGVVKVAEPGGGGSDPGTSG
ncbi:MAG: hypothetical protein ACKO5K_16600, partial [Armatimonadota bacterium]